MYAGPEGGSSRDSVTFGVAAAASWGERRGGGRSSLVTDVYAAVGAFSTFAEELELLILATVKATPTLE